VVHQDRAPFDLATKVPARRLEIRVGKMSLPDQFDTNEVGSDSHLQFMNWTVDSNEAWDYAADTRGYTVGGIIEAAAAYKVDANAIAAKVKHEFAVRDKLKTAKRPRRNLRPKRNRRLQVSR
jgi:hypothetical protein